MSESSFKSTLLVASAAHWRPLPAPEIPALHHPKDVKSMHSFVARHQVDKQGYEHRWNSDSNPSVRVIAWLAWGGNTGKLWKGRKLRALD